MECGKVEVLITYKNYNNKTVGSYSSSTNEEDSRIEGAIVIAEGVRKY